VAHRARRHALLIVFSAFLLTLPLPSPPFSRLECAAQLWRDSARCEHDGRDGVMHLVRYLASVAATVYFVLLGGLIVKTTSCSGSQAARTAGKLP